MTSSNRTEHGFLIFYEFCPNFNTNHDPNRQSWHDMDSYARTLEGIRSIMDSKKGGMYRNIRGPYKMVLVEEPVLPIIEDTRNIQV